MISEIIRCLLAFGCFVVLLWIAYNVSTILGVITIYIKEKLDIK